MHFKFFISAFILLAIRGAYSQLPVGRDTITVIENGKILKSPWAGGLNFCQFSKIDLNNDGKKDIVVFDKVNSIAFGIIRCFLNVGAPGEDKYVSDGNYSSKFPKVDSWVSFQDYNGDGKEDIFTYIIGGIKVYKNVSTPGNLAFQLEKPRLKSDYNPLGSPSIGNIYSSPQSVPGFADMDNDGDLDILTFSSLGIKIEYHKNQSKELYGHSDSLIFDMVDYCWGDISESGCAVNLSDCPLKLLLEKTENETNKILHAGSCLMCFDRDNDGDQDILMGDISCSHVIYMENGGSVANAHVSDTTILYPNYPTKANTNIIRFNTFPCTYYVDVDNDGKKDLLASPNATGENYNSIWYYRNTGVSSNEFTYVKSNFLQEEMIEVGEGTAPHFFDYDNDGLKDLLIGNTGYYIGNTNKSRLTFYKNTGTSGQPTYSLITRDFAGLSLNNISSMSPTTADIDGDGDIDLLIGDAYGKIHWVENTAGAGNTCNFSIFKNDPFGFSTLSANAYPQAIDVDRDSKTDLLIGTKNGRIAYYRNTGTVSSPSFSLVTNSFGGVNVTGTGSGLLDGYCTPFMYDESGNYKLLCGSNSGRIFFYDNIDGNLNGNFNRLDTNVNKIYEGMQSTLQYTDLNNDGLRDLITGNYAGGLCFFSSKNPIGMTDYYKEDVDVISVFPNPANDIVTIKVLPAFPFETEIFDFTGKLLYKKPESISSISINTAFYSNGVYLLRISFPGKSEMKPVNKKLIVQND